MSKMSNEEFIEIYKNKFENIKLDDIITFVAEIKMLLKNE